MAELNLKQITDKLNAEFAGKNRKLVFWYDDKAEFADDIDSLELVGAKVFHLEPDNQFYTKYLLERLDRKTNYLIYAPFAKPPVRDNHLEDTILYSRQFSATRADLIASDLHMDEITKSFIQKYKKFFKAKDRTQRFYELGVEKFSQDSIETAIMSVICGISIVSFDEILRVILTDGDLKDNRFLSEIDQYELLQAFWGQCEEQFGYTDQKPTLERLMITMFVTYTARFLHNEMPIAWKNFLSSKAGSVIAFMDSLMNNVIYRERYDELSDYIAAELRVSDILEKYSAESLIDCDAFAVIDKIIIKWIVEQLLNENSIATIRGKYISDVCADRCKKHFGDKFYNEYQMLRHADPVVFASSYHCPDTFEEISEQYLSDCTVDMHYRVFYYFFDTLADTSEYEKLRALVENIYTNEYLNELLPKWTAAFSAADGQSSMHMQRSFFNNFVRRTKEKVVVIISDALRYETGRTLFLKLRNDPKCTVKLDAMLSTLPSYTRLGMAALLPHKTLEMTDDFKVLIDGKPCDDLRQRESVLQSYVPNSRCVQFDDIKGINDKTKLREIFTGMDTVYVYHNQIDARGDKQNTENEVFVACREAIDEVYGLIKKLSGSGNIYHFIVTADHGFIYKRDKLSESDKIDGFNEKGAFVNRRFIVSKNEVKDDGIASYSMGKVLENADDKMVSFPVSSNVFKVPGGGQNYVHGGCSPQEMIVPIIDVKTEKGYIETRPAQIMLVSMVQKITNLIASLDFIQTEPVSDIVKTTGYKLFFISEDNEKISNECTYVADKKEAEPQKRIFRLRFNFKDKKYDKSKKYYLVAYDEKKDFEEVLRHEVAMDIVFANDFGFNV